MSELAFTNPAMLWGLLAATLPVIIHLINRHRARRHPFAALDFLLRVQRRTARRILLRHILLLIARTLAIVCLVLSAAGPVLRPRTAATATSPATTVLVIDRSMSMQAKAGDHSNLERAVALATQTVRGMTENDRMCLLCAAAEVETLVEPCTNARATLLDALDRIRPSYQRSDLTAALERAATLLAGEIGPRVRLYTDAAAHAFGETLHLPPGHEPPAVFLADVAGDERDNHALAGIELGGRGGLLEVAVRVASFANATQEGLQAEVRLGDATPVRGFVDLASREVVRKVFSLTAPAKAAMIGTVSITPDLLASDDKRLFYVTGTRQVSALLVNGDMRPVLQQDELFYLEHALSPAGEGEGGISFLTVTPERCNAQMLQGVQVVFLANVRELPAELVSALRAFVASGGGLFVSLGSQIDVERFNSVFGELVPWPLRDIVSLGPTDADGSNREGLPITEVRLDHPALQIFKGEGERALGAVRTTRAAVIEPGAARVVLGAAQILMRFADGSPALLEGSLGRGRILLWTATLDRDWTSWPARASFLPFLQRAAAYLAGHLTELPPPEVEVAQPVRIPLVPGTDQVTVVGPDGKRQRLAPTDLRQGAAWFSATETPGWYSVEFSAAGIRLPTGSIPGFVVHPPARESDLAPLAQDRLQALLGQSGKVTLDAAGAGQTRSRTLLFVLLALLLALMEAFLVRR